MTFYNPLFPPFLNFPNHNSTIYPKPVENNLEKDNKKSCKNDFVQNHSYNIFEASDSLIILSILYILYTQKKRNIPLMLCLFLLLFD